jgi:hypothetical protein
MMSNYDRTMELVNAANNSAGASQKQFGKTLDSLEAKLQKLENAWNTFVMGLANSDVIKMGVDLLTNLLETLNSMTDNLGDVAGGFAKLTMVVAGLKTGKGIFDSLFDIKGAGGKAKELSAIGSLVGTAFSKMGKSSAEGLKLPQDELDRISSQFSTATKHANLLGVSLGALG